MRKIIKKANSKLILLFLLGLFSVGVQGQYDEYGGGNTDGYNDGFVSSYHTGGTYINGVNEYGVQRTYMGNGPQTSYTGSDGTIYIVTHPIYSYGYLKKQDTTPGWNPYAGALDPSVVGPVGGAIGGYNPSIQGNKPLTESQFVSYRERIPNNYIITSKINQTITTSDGKTHTGVLYKFQNDLTPKHTYYYFKPSSSQTLSTELYYFFPDKIGDKATTNTGGTVTLGNLGINYTYDSTGFPRGQGYLINTVGTEIGISISPNVSYSILEKFTFNHSIYNQEFELIGPVGDIRYKTENNVPIFAPIYEQLMLNSYGDMGSDLSLRLNYYKTKVNINSSIASDVNIFTAELKSYLAGNGSMSTSSQEFIDWLVSVSAIQIGAVNTNFEILEAPEFSSAFAEDNDFAKSTDPFFTNKTDDPWRLKNLLSPDDSYVVGILAGLGDGCIETADLASTLVKFSVKNQPNVLLVRLVVDTENTIKEKIEEIKVVRDLVSLVYDKPRQDLIFNTIKTEVADWFDAATFQKTNVQAGYAQGKIVFEILGAFLGVAEVKALLKTGQFTASAAAKIASAKDLFSLGNKIRKIDGVIALVDNTGTLITKGDKAVETFLNAKYMQRGARPAPNTYLDPDYITNHLSKFENEGTVSRIVSKSNYNNYGIGKPDLGKTEFVGLKSEIDNILKLPLSEQATKLGVPIDQLQNGDLIRIDFKLSNTYKAQMPSGNEYGANSQWIPGGKLPTGLSEAVIKTEGMQLNINYFVKQL